MEKFLPIIVVVILVLSGIGAVAVSKDNNDLYEIQKITNTVNIDSSLILKESTEDFIEELLGKDNIKRLNKRQLERLKEVKTLSSVKDTGHIPNKEENNKEPSKKMTINEWLRK